MKIYKIECEWEMPIARGYFMKEKSATDAINNEDWELMTGWTLEEVKKERRVFILPIDVKP